MNANFILSHLINFTSKVKFIKLMSFFMFLYVYRNNKNRKGITVLCLTRRSNVYDVKALKMLEKRFNFIELPFNILKLAQKWLPKSVQTFYQKELQHRSDIVKYSTVMADYFLNFLRNIGGYDVKFILSANFDYYEDFIFKNHSSIKYIALSKEHYIIPSSYNRGLKRYKNNYQYNGAAIFLYGVQTKRLLQEADICLSNQLMVTGCPRMDLLKEIDDKDVNRNYITLFSFIDGLYDGTNTFYEILDAFLILAQRYPSQSFMVKCKSTVDYDILNKFTKGYKNILLTYEIEYLKTFKISKMIVSFNSNSILEGVLSGAILVIPYWGDTKKDGFELLIDPDANNRDLFNFAKSKEELLNFIENVILKGDSGVKVDYKERMKELNKYFYLPERNCSNVVGDELEKLVN